MLYNTVIISVCIIASIIYFILKPDKKEAKVIIFIIFILGILIRTLNIQNLPNAINIDEASSGYEAYSIMKNGIDRNGKSFPVFLISWGSGQNALYTYLIIPFVKILGLNVISTRLPMAIVGCISLIIMYKLLKKTKDEKTALVGMAFLAICPWHIMKSRWGLESNLFPDLVLWSVYLIFLYIKDKKILKLYLAFALLGLSAYSYGTAYFFLPIFAIGSLIYLVIKKEITIKQAIASLLCLIAVALPIILYVVINYFNLPEIKFLCFTIPKTTAANRFTTESSLFSGNIIINSLKNFYESIKVLLLQKDDAPWNALPFFGITYFFSLPFFAIGIVKELKNKEVTSGMWKIWIASGIALMFVSVANINKMNIVIIPIIYYTIIGITEIVKQSNKCKIIIVAIYTISFIAFIINYTQVDSSKYYTFSNEIEEVINYIEEQEAETVKNIYFPYSIKEPYIYILFYSKMDTNEFLNTRKLKKPNGSFENINACGKYIFYKETINFEEEKENIYIVNSEEKLQLDESLWQIKVFTKYKVLRYMGEQ